MACKECGAKLGRFLIFKDFEVCQECVENAPAYESAPIKTIERKTIRQQKTCGETIE